MRRLLRQSPSVRAARAKPADDGEEVTKPKRRTTRTTRAKRTAAADSSAPISDEVAQARALAQISEAQVVRARRRAAEREAAALTELAAPFGARDACRHRDPCRRPANREAGTAHTPSHGC